MEKKAITIKEVAVSDKVFLYDLAETKGVKPGEALTLLIENWKTRLDKSVIDDENKLLTEQVASLTEQLQAETALKNTAIADYNKVSEELEVVNSKITVYDDRVTTLEKELEAERAAPVSDKLTGAQFVCELDDATAMNARTARKFVKRDGFVPADTTDNDYPNALVNVAVKEFLKNNFSSIIKK